MTSMDVTVHSKAEAGSDADQREWLKVPEIADLLGVPRTRAYDLIQRGQLPAVRIGERTIRVNKRELERFLLEERRVVAR
jgi:excisionase family DNA binding protein